MLIVDLALLHYIMSLKVYREFLQNIGERNYSIQLQDSKSSSNPLVEDMYTVSIDLRSKLLASQKYYHSLPRR